MPDITVNFKYDSFDEYYVQYLVGVLQSLNFNCETERNSTIQDGGVLKVSWNMSEVMEKKSRKAGRVRIRIDYSLEEVKDMMKEKSASDVAKELGMSRSTLFKKIKEAEENHGEFLIPSYEKEKRKLERENQKKNTE